MWFPSCSISLCSLHDCDQFFYTASALLAQLWDQAPLQEVQNELMSKGWSSATGRARVGEGL